MLESARLDETSIRYMMRLAGPIVVTTMTFTMMQFVDRLMVAQLGTAALAAVFPAGFIGMLPAGFLIGVLAGVSTFVSQSMGRGEKQNCSSYCWQAIYMGLIYFAAVTVIMWPLAPAIFKVMGYTPDVVELEVVYFRITLLADCMAVFIWACSEFFIGIHRPAIIMYASLTAQVVNVVCNYIFIYGKLGFPAMGIAGAAWGTFAGSTVGGLMRLIMFLSGDINRKFNSIKTMKIDFHKMADLLRVGFPAGLELMLNMSLWGIILCWLVSRFGKEAQAATSAALACASMSIVPIVGLRNALTAAVGKSIGAGHKNAATKQTRTCLRIAIGYMGFMGIFFLVFRRQLIMVWSSDSHVIAVGTQVMICAAFYQVFHATQTIYSGALRGAGDTLWLAFSSATGSILVLGVGGFATVTFLPQLGPLGPWIAATLSIVTIGLTNRFRFKSNHWKNIDLFRREIVVETIEA